MNIQFINTSEWGIKKKDFDLSVKRLKKHVSEVGGVFNVVFVDDTYIESLNRTYRDKEEPTDVLSFSYLDGADELLGEIYISIDTARKQAEEHKLTLKYELNKLFVHGFLHVFGHKHDSENDFKKMNKIEREVLGE